MNTEKNTKSTKNSENTYSAKGRQNLFLYDPADIILVTDPKSPNYDERVHLPVDEKLVLNIMTFGVIEPVILSKNPESGLMEASDGRQRIKAAREANKRLQASGQEPKYVQAVVLRAYNDNLTAIGATANSHRQEETPMSKAQKMARLLDKGQSEEQVSIIFGCTKQTIKNHMALLSCTAAVRNAVESGKVSASNAYQLSRLDPDEQRAKVEELINVSNAPSKGKRGKRAAARQKNNIVRGPSMRTKTEINALLFKLKGSTVDPKFAQTANQILNWVLGGAEPRLPAKKEVQVA